MSSLDWVQADDIESVYRPVSDHPASGRCANRVRVKLRVAIATRQCAYLAETIDVSETGILIANYGGPPISCGRRVGILIRGIIADDQVDEFFMMRVRRSDGSRLALSFS